ncbi:capsid cement protein [Microbulbifer sp. ANSA003]|uniref:capsid cement protein n=1 Tax=Microbulbifer sp. ANSA003 TaxID=3243360 RepID=UPI0040432E0F
MQSISLLTLTLAATAAISAGRFTAGDGTTASAGGNALGVSRCSAEAGEDFPVDVIGTAQVTAAGAIAVDDAIEVGADGKAATKSSGVTVARALQAASSDGDSIEVLLIAN